MLVLAKGITTQRRISLGEHASGGAELYLYCPLYGIQVVLDGCIGCDFYRGLTRDSEGGCYLRCRVPDAVLAKGSHGGKD